MWTQQAQERKQQRQEDTTGKAFRLVLEHEETRISTRKGQKEKNREYNTRLPFPKPTL